MRHDHLQPRVAVRDGVHIQRTAVLYGCVGSIGGAHVHGQRQVVLHQILVHRLQPRVEQGDAVVDRAELDALELQVFDGVHQQVHAVRHARVQTGKSDELLRITRHQARRHFIVAVDADRILVAQREHDGPVDVAHGVLHDVRVGGQLDCVGTGETRHLQMQRQDLRVLVHIHMAIDDHGCCSWLTEYRNARIRPRVCRRGASPPMCCARP